MAVDLICPDCGGVIGATKVDAEGRGPCTCYQPNNSDSSISPSSPSDTVSIPAQPTAPAAATPAPAAPAQPAKYCIVCGKNVIGHRRVKDSRGYLCYDCAKKEIKEEKAGTVPCADCNRRIRPDGLVDYEGKKICKVCLNHHRETERLKKKVATHEFDKSEKRSVIILSVIFGVLALIILVQLVRKLF